LLIVLTAVYVPFLNPFLDTVPLSIGDWLFMIPFMCIASIAAEITKFHLRQKASGMVTAPMH
jgi:hypothetical protein